MAVVASESLHRRVERVARMQPQAVALIENGAAMTYEELLERARSVSASLRARGSRPGDVVAVIAPRSADYAVALLGALGAGAACLPIDPEEPHARRASIVAMAAVRFAITAADVRLPDVVCVPVRGEVARMSPWDAVSSSSVAFVFATSGSTGSPKAVALTHETCLHGTRWAADVLGLGPSDRHLFRTSVAFVSVLRQLIWPLVTGGTVVVMPPGGERDLVAVAGMLADARITVTTFIPSALRVVLPHLPHGSCEALRHLLCGGEVLTEALREQIFTRLAAEVHNLYALTEAPLVTHHRCCREERGAAPLGSPLPGTMVRIVKEGGEPAHRGEEGELFVGGPGIAAGYLARPDLDEARFLHDRDGARWLRSGDIVRIQSDGALSFVSRADDLLKIRGFRIEPAEIEMALAEHEAIAAAAVVPQRHGDRTSLAAFIVPAEPRAPALAAVRSYLAGRLPTYLMPDRIFAVDDLPRLPSGKVNRAALSSLEAQPPPGPAQPADPLEAAICRIWREVLQVESVGADTGFRDLGGDSLAAVEIAFRVEELLGMELSFEVFEQASTVAQLAAACRRLGAPGQVSAFERIEARRANERRIPAPVRLRREREC